MRQSFRYYSARIKKAFRVLRNISGIMEAPSSAHFDALKRRITDAFPPQNSQQRILLVTSNGAGLGHLTRLNAVAQHLDGDVLIYTMSSAYKTIARDPRKIIYFPSYGDLGMSGQIWNRFMQAHLEATIESFAPDLVVFDGTYVYRGVSSSCRKAEVPLVWLQRGAWKQEVDSRSKQRHNAHLYCDYVVVPRDHGFVEEVDCGPDIDVMYVDPVVLGEESDLLPAEEAREILEIPKGKKAVLIQLGAGRINSIQSALEEAITAVQSLGDSWLPVVVRNPLSEDGGAKDIHSISYYPLSRVYRAFEFGVFAAGYNSVQESVEFGLPGVFVPNEFTKTDDQVARASKLASAGLGLCARDSAELREQIVDMADPERRQNIAIKMAAASGTNGAKQAAELFSSLASQRIAKTSGEKGNA